MFGLAGIGSSLIGGLTELVTRHPWGLAAVCFPLTVACMIASRLAYGRRWKLMDEGIAYHRGEALAAKGRFLANVLKADSATLETIIGDPSAPEELRQELREQLARRRAGLN